MASYPECVLANKAGEEKWQEEVVYPLNISLSNNKFHLKF